MCDEGGAWPDKSFTVSKKIEGCVASTCSWLRTQSGLQTARDVGRDKGKEVLWGEAIPYGMNMKPHFRKINFLNFF